MNEKIKVFISQPMSGLSDEHILDQRRLAITLLENFIFPNDEVEILSTFIEDDLPEAIEASKSGVWYLGRSLQMLANADYIYMCKGWEKARGCCIELETAEKYGINVLYYPNSRNNLHCIDLMSKEDVPEEKEPSVDERILKELQDLKSIASEIMIFLSIESTKLQDKTTVSLGDIQRYERYRENYVAKKRLVKEEENNENM